MHETLHRIFDKYIYIFIVDIDECIENPCQNGNPCIDGLSHRLCLCMNEYTGLDCERSKLILLNMCPIDFTLAHIITQSTIFPRVSSIGYQIQSYF